MCAAGVSGGGDITGQRHEGVGQGSEGLRGPHPLDDRSAGNESPCACVCSYLLCPPVCVVCLSYLLCPPVCVVCLSYLLCPPVCVVCLSYLLCPPVCVVCLSYLLCVPMFDLLSCRVDLPSPTPGKEEEGGASPSSSLPSCLYVCVTCWHTLWRYWAMASVTGP